MTQSKFSKIYNSLRIASIVQQWLLCLSVYFIVAVPLFSIELIRNNSKQNNFAYNATFILLMLVFLTFRRRSQINRTTRTNLLNSRHSLLSTQTLRLRQRRIVA